MAYEKLQSKTFLVFALCVAGIFFVSNMISAFHGWHFAYLKIFINLAVILVLLFKYRHAKAIVKIWAALPIVSFCLFLLASALRGRWGAQPTEHVFAAILGITIFFWVNKAFVDSKTESDTVTL